MGMMKWLLAALFVVHVEIPLGVKETYEAVDLVVHPSCYELTLANGRKMWVPTAFTIIVERKQ